ncbi:MAG TPA: recombinase family protein [Armatimonadota bacterium]|nr:recombinase family protein [Armatimonadota bacterium]
MTRVAAYCRVSTEQGDQHNSFENQKFFFERLISERPDWILAGIYADEGITGTMAADRTGFLKMIDDALASRFELILTKEVSRFSRNILDTIAYTRLLKSAGVGVIFLNDGISTLDPDAELRLGIMASVAQEESRKTSERVKWGQRRKMERGVVFGRSLLGYDVKGGRIEIEPEGAGTVRTIFGLYVDDGMGVRRIADTLSGRGIQTFSGNNAWSGGAVLKILRNEKYCGDLCQRKTVVKDYLTHKKTKNREAGDMIRLRDHHEPIVSRDVWERAQVELTRRASGKQPSEKNQSTGCGSRYPLSGKISCASCGSIFLCRTRKQGDGSRYRVWRRTCRCAGIPCQIREDILDRCVRRFVSAIGAERLLEGFRDVLDKAAAGRDTESRSTEVSLAAAEKKLTRLANAYIDGDIGRKAYLELREACENSRRLLGEKLDRLSSREKDVTETITDIAISTATGIDQDSDFYLALIDHIEIRSDGGADLLMHGLSEPILAY